MAPDYPLILEDCEYDELSWSNTDPALIASFHHTFNEIVYRKSIEQVMLINCMLMAQQQLLTTHSITQDAFRHTVIEHSRKIASSNCKQLQMHKSSGRGLAEAVSNLKGKKKELYLKKMEKQQLYDEKVRQ